MNAITPRAMHAIRTTAEDACDTLRARSRGAARAAARQVRRHPFAAVTLAAAAGALVVHVVRRR